MTLQYTNDDNVAMKILRVLPATSADHWNAVHLHQTVQLTSVKRKMQMKLKF